VIQIVSSTLGVTWNLHNPYHPQSSGKVERMNEIIKGKKLKNLSIELHLPCTQLLQLALTWIRATPQGPSFLSPFEIMYGCPFFLGNLPLTDPAPLADYLPYLNLLRQLLREHADQILPQPLEGPINTSVQPGDLVLLEDLQSVPLGPHGQDHTWSSSQHLLLSSSM
jgi:hypothetical protein